MRGTYQRDHRSDSEKIRLVKEAFASSSTSKYIDDNGLTSAKVYAWATKFGIPTKTGRIPGNKLPVTPGKVKRIEKSVADFIPQTIPSKPVMAFVGSPEDIVRTIKELFR